MAQETHPLFSVVLAFYATVIGGASVFCGLFLTFAAVYVNVLQFGLLAG
jgi:hypothetical protein